MTPSVDEQPGGAARKPGRMDACVQPTDSMTRLALLVKWVAESTGDAPLEPALERVKEAHVGVVAETVTVQAEHFGGGGGGVALKVTWDDTSCRLQNSGVKVWQLTEPWFQGRTARSGVGCLQRPPSSSLP